MGNTTEPLRIKKSSKLNHGKPLKKTLYDLELDHKFTLVQKLHDADFVLEGLERKTLVEQLKRSNARLQELDTNVNSFWCNSTTYQHLGKEWVKRYGHLPAYAQWHRYFIIL